MESWLQLFRELGIKSAMDLLQLFRELEIKSAMDLLQLFREFEIQLLVLLSFMIQVFLFFTGGLRRRTTSNFLRFLMWLAYLGADMVAVYTLGLVSRHDECRTLRGSHQLVFLWAPFLLVHLGGQDTVTAFAIEDNNLWLRHLLNLVVQSSLVLYIFWKLADGLNRQLLVPGIFVFVSGIIKYGERSWALWCGRLKPLEANGGPAISEPIGRRAHYSAIVSKALHSMPGVRDVFADSPGICSCLYHTEGNNTTHPDLSPRLLEIELGLMYDDIFTKAKVLRTRGGIILRCISQISTVVAFVVFLVSNTERFESVDIAITYALFTGGFFLEVCAIVITVRSPWTWEWLKARKCRSLSKCLLSNNIGWGQERSLWSNSMGQYNLPSNFWLKYGQQSSLWKRRVMAVIIKVVDAVGGSKLKLWISKLLDTKIIKVDEEVISCVVQFIQQCRSDLDQHWPELDPVVEKFVRNTEDDLKYFIVFFHVYTEVLLSRCPPTREYPSASVCRKLSNYMVYILATRPEMLPVRHADGTLENFLQISTERVESEVEDVILSELSQADVILDDLIDRYKWGITVPYQDCAEAQLSEIKKTWILLLVYAVGKSRPEAHAAQLARGGELLTFAWLLMKHNKLSFSGMKLSELFGVDSNVTD